MPDYLTLVKDKKQELSLLHARMQTMMESAQTRSVQYPEIATTTTPQYIPVHLKSATEKIIIASWELMKT